MKILYLDLSMGAAGDMLTAALYDLLDDKRKKEFLDRINSLGIQGVKVSATKCEKCGITGTHMEVLIDGVSEHEHDHEHEHEHEHHHEHEHEHEHEHHHEHHHSDMNNIRQMVSSMPVSDKVASDIVKVYDLIAEAEAAVHGKNVDMIHFHEVGDKDAIADVAAVCILMEMHSFDKIYASAVCTGFGKVKCAHGILPVPAPATAHLLRNIPIYAGSIEAELCTPTGAALVRYFTDEFKVMPQLCVSNIGYGMGTKDFEAANCIRAYMASGPDSRDEITELSCNVDDMTGEAVGYATEVFMREGAVDVYTVQIGMKKGRPGIMINVLCHPDDERKFAELMFRHTSTLGIRVRRFDRYVMDRQTLTEDSAFGDVRIKRSEGFGTSRRKYEYEDICRIANDNDMSFDETVKALYGVVDDQNDDR